MTEGLEPRRQLPIILPPVSDELLSSWITRHATFYGVPPLIMLQHCLPEASSLRAADFRLTDVQIRRLSKMFAMEPHALRRMTFVNVAQTRLIAATPVHSCPKCISANSDPKPIMRGQIQGWRITCPVCESPLHGNREPEVPSPFRCHWSSALRGQKLVDNEVERGHRTWARPTDIARLLLMRRLPKTISAHTHLEQFRVLGAILPELDDVVAEKQIILPSPASPVLPLHLRPALLAGVAIVERAGPAMLEMLHAHTLGENRTRFGRLAAATIGSDRLLKPTQLQLI